MKDDKWTQGVTIRAPKEYQKNDEQKTKANIQFFWQAMRNQHSLTTVSVYTPHQQIV